MNNWERGFINNTCEKDTRVLIDFELSMGQLCDVVAKILIQSYATRTEIETFQNKRQSSHSSLSQWDHTWSVGLGSGEHSGSGGTRIYVEWRMIEGSHRQDGKKAMIGILKYLQDCCIDGERKFSSVAVYTENERESGINITGMFFTIWHVLKWNGLQLENMSCHSANQADSRGSPVEIFRGDFSSVNQGWTRWTAAWAWESLYQSPYNLHIVGQSWIIWYTFRWFLFVFPIKMEALWKPGRVSLSSASPTFLLVPSSVAPR